MGIFVFAYLEQKSLPSLLLECTQYENRLVNMLVPEIVYDKFGLSKLAPELRIRLDPKRFDLIVSPHVPEPCPASS